jgi:hypothetical protein
VACVIIVTEDGDARLDALDGELTAVHRLVLHEVMDHICDIEARIGRFETELIRALGPYMWDINLLQTIPKIDAIGAAKSMMVFVAAGRREKSPS